MRWSLRFKNFLWILIRRLKLSLIYILFFETFKFVKNKWDQSLYQDNVFMLDFRGFHTGTGTKLIKVTSINSLFH